MKNVGTVRYSQSNFLHGCRKLFSIPVCFGPASPDAGVELLRQLFLQCREWKRTRQGKGSLKGGGNGEGREKVVGKG